MNALVKSKRFSHIYNDSIESIQPLLNYLNPVYAWIDFFSLSLSVLSKELSARTSPQTCTVFVREETFLA